MIDIHSHIIFGVDDGPSTIEESLKMVSEAVNAGIKIIISTPHFQKEVFENDKIVENYNMLVNRASDFDISILLGYEVLISLSLAKMLADSKPLTLNNSGYLLLELPFDSIPIYIYEVIFQLQLLGVTVVIAHPERNMNLINNFDSLLGLVERGCLIQLDAASIVGIYGRHVKGFTKKLIKLKLVHFIASDAHSAKDYANWYLKAYKKVNKWVGEDYADKLFTRNASAIVQNDFEKARVYEAIGE
jgi:protein-tyrosine phosphatase